jgi:hypothetical protein
MTNLEKLTTKDINEHRKLVRDYTHYFANEIKHRGNKDLRALVYGSDEYKENLKRLKPALDHHYKLNSHHPEHFEYGLHGMTLIDLLEMVSDWKAAVKRHSTGDIKQSLEINTERFAITPQLKNILENTLDLLE